MTDNRSMSEVNESLRHQLLNEWKMMIDRSASEVMRCNMVLGDPDNPGYEEETQAIIKLHKVLYAGMFIAANEAMEAHLKSVQVAMKRTEEASDER